MHESGETGTLALDATGMGRRRDMVKSSKRARIAGAATAIAVATVMTAGASGALAQEYLGSTVSIGGGVSGVGDGDIVVMAPGVTISGGEVSNSTGIGVNSGGGSSIGAATGGDTNASLTE
jgi:hypothetical protein